MNIKLAVKDSLREAFFTKKPKKSSINESTMVLHRIEGNPSQPLNPPVKGKVSNTRSLFGLFFTEDKPNPKNMYAGSQHDTYVGKDLKLFDWDAYGNGPWDKFNNKTTNPHAEQNVIETKQNLLKRGYDGIIVHENGFGTTIVVFPESINKVKKQESINEGDNLDPKNLVVSDKLDSLGNWWMRPNLQYIKAYRTDSVEGGKPHSYSDHETAALIELGKPHPSYPYRELFNRGYVRIVNSSDRIIISGGISQTQLRKLYNTCIEINKRLIYDNGRSDKVLYEPRQQSQLAENLLLESLFGQRLYLVIDTKLNEIIKVKALLSTNTKSAHEYSTGYRENEYRITWFTFDKKEARGHIDFTRGVMKYIMKTKTLPDELKERFAKIFIAKSPESVSIEFVDKFEDDKLHEDLLLLEESDRELEMWIENKRLINESMYVYIDGADYTDKLTELNSMCHRLLKEVLLPILNKLPEDQQEYFRKNGVGYYDTIIPDGGYNTDRVGVISVYLQGFTSNTMREVVRGIFQRLRGWKIKWKQPKIEKSGMFSGNVLRIPVVENNSSYSGPPEMNLSNANAYAIFHNVLQYEGVHDFSMEPNELIQRITTVLNHDQSWIDKNTRSHVDSDWPQAERDDTSNEPENPHVGDVGDSSNGGVRMINMGLNSGMINRNLLMILKIAKWAVEHGYKRMYVA